MNLVNWVDSLGLGVAATAAGVSIWQSVSAQRSAVAASNQATAAIAQANQAILQAQAGVRQAQACEAQVVEAHTQTEAALRQAQASEAQVGFLEWQLEGDVKTAAEEKSFVGQMSAVNVVTAASRLGMSFCELLDIIETRSEIRVPAIVNMEMKHTLAVYHDASRRAELVIKRTDVLTAITKLTDSITGVLDAVSSDQDNSWNRKLGRDISLSEKRLRRFNRRRERLGYALTVWREEGGPSVEEASEP